MPGFTAKYARKNRNVAYIKKISRGRLASDEIEPLARYKVNIMNETERRFLQLFDELQRDTLDLHAFFELIGDNTPANHQSVLSTIENLLAKRWLAELGGDFYSRTQAGRDELNRELARK